ncbi:alpha,alpha-trehalose-phosphate synthase [UDP-forming] 1 [Diospyros lotus]|uniref:alpha,alpha-trehalose-phosphate synthase [UDP-forming] 1 n=1 Tax=Diospyros lotus TaxID=55363 RepID=UPI0022541D6C|nr:alpha,alpha-trehalose-phosphate synthase [UDP-forming] 1 [Diospyros lotus]XP_052177115.1 alpha,alpha-trehalose-phosphate synthase [UDP-forming] 1 [Diospyros lotus]XP_052177117.1 alpha,alpha-trehalose-phosphate synthase [UDP-forming] 1 [Diospyros lotus]XP_052177118.1 alpha,alpha-trehalose-phosphate synthase [UDP-forming] 1 [Diospyros lotus]XP_052177119.1 alpha,alpha-trehalose-phosphate synthase [UDP-forming] 1 [Diospyros lotus]XP_052177120.1 alpha,alpha-trehalose-phosphate synthase [UDP-form
MPGNKYNGNNGISAIPSSRVERLLRHRELRRFGRISHSNETTDSNRGTVLSEHELNLREGDNSRASYVEQYLEEAWAAQALGEGWERPDGRPFRQRLLVVANRLPVSAVRRGEESWSLEISAGGLVTALLGVKEFEARWIGWAGVNVPDEPGQRALTKALAEKRCIPVFLDEETVHQYYNGYCNNILWPLFHYLGLPQEDRLATTRSFQSQFDAYKKANQMFAEVVNDHYEEGDVVWCHDYHLMFLPKCLKEYNRKMKVGWFLHTPFPSSEIHRTLPSRSDLLRAVLAADLVGFHTYDYARHFVSACTRILGLEGTPEGVEDQGRLTRVAAFPIGIDSERFIRALEVPQVQEHIRELKERFAGRKVMLGVDRLDMIKGIPQKILAFEKFLEENPSWRDKVVLLQIAVPTRTDVPEYQKLTSQVHEIVGRINGRFGTLTAVPIHHLDRSLDFHALCALYAVTDVALVTSLRDGMNLVSYEFVACQESKKGVLILSEFAGAAQSLGAGAILVNPWNITEVATSIGQALNMSAEEREKRHRHNFVHVTTHTAQEWAETFVSELNDTVVEAQIRIRRAPPPLPVKEAIERYLQSNNRLLILGFNATLTEAVDNPGRRGGDQIKEMELKLHPDLKEPLKALCDDLKTTIVVLSGSGRRVLDYNFSEYNMWLAAENGMFLRFTKGDWMTTMPEHLNMEWVDSIKHVFEYFTDRTPRSHFETRETSLVWNYKYADVEFGRLQARDMLQHLWTGPISNASVDVVQGSRSVEVRAVGVTKGAALDRILGEIVHSKSISTPIDYVLCIGHFLGKDEDVYTFFEPDLPSKLTDPPKLPVERRQSLKLPSSRSSSKSSHSKIQRPLPNPDKKSYNQTRARRPSPEKTSLNVLDLKGENYFSCAVSRTRTNARYVLGSSDEVVAFMKELAGASVSSSSSPG